MRAWCRQLGWSIIVSVLFALGGMSLLAGGLYASYVVLQNWIIR
jgi:hypothetical protein